MPRISDFFGIAIYMHYNEGSHKHPHFHAEYGDYLASIGLDGEIIVGTLPPRQVQLIRDWAHAHEEAIERNWELARSGQPLERISPLT